MVIELDGNNKKFNFEIINYLGQIVFKGYLYEKTKVSTRNYMPGIYIVILESNKGFVYKKIIKE